MEKTTIDSLLNSLTALVGDSRSSLFGQDKCMVDRDQLLYLVDCIQTQLPQEISQAKAVIESSNEIRTSARKEAAETRKNADKLLTEAEERAARLIEETTIVEFAKKREQEILEEAEQQRQLLISGAINYAERIIEDAEQAVTESYDALIAGISALQSRAKEDKKAALDQLTEARKVLKNANIGEQNSK